MSLTMFQVDAFTTRVFAGNPAAVLIIDDWLDDQAMLAIAQENNLAETAFAKPTGDGFGLRWFTPVHEVEFCGHATLATAHVLFAHYGATGDLSFDTRVGRLNVRRNDRCYALDLPVFPPDRLGASDPDLALLLTQPLVATFRNFENYFAVLPDANTLRTLAPDLAKIESLFPFGLCVTSPGDGPDFLSRYFAPGAGIPEDPVTGSTHATLVPYWADRLGKTSLSAHQASRRGGDLACSLTGDRVTLEGNCVTFMKAEVYLPT
ncbi:PhzF family phenazine biosynthesis protein [uncultured Tateyamaria sp.]|uniref:PhzF family phenazine biosynthesis protein n=1 Tax=uncultured Tateyamaria sp. TaxID=455651 RepID=UPI0026109FE1|nr:PhzF family phenazine biosynthesis protein [uncultured Tateyamaria sp.]